MKRTYIDIPQYTTLRDISQKNYTLSATQYKNLCIKNHNLRKVSEFLERELNRADLGNEVGSEGYVDESLYTFIKTKALQTESFLLDEAKDSIEKVIPQKYTNMNLRKGDILISKDSNVGETVYIDKDYKNAMFCSGIYRLPIEKKKFYLLAFLKSEVFRQQIDYIVPRGSTIRHGKTKFLDCYIPFPNYDVERTVRYVELLTEAIINKEIEIRERYKKVINSIQNELERNQKDSKFKFSLPSINEIISCDRMDSSIYSKDFKEKEYLITNYKYGTSSIKKLGFDFVRGNNLAVTCIGKSIYSDEYMPGFYKLILPKNISLYGTMNKIQYLGNKSNLIEIKRGAIIFGAEGNEKGRSWVALETPEKTITNFHGLTLYQRDSNIYKSIFVKLFMDYYRAKGMIDCYATGGNGGSLSIKYWEFIKFPNFPEATEKEIITLYHNPIIYDISKCDICTFSEYDKEFNHNAGIHELDKAMKYLKELLNQVIDDIANDRRVEMIF